MKSEPLIPKHGGYRRLKSFQVAELIYDVTVRFCEKHIERRSRTHDQMVQAARSGVQNIAEGSQASGTSKKTELKLTNVARASLEELRLDYEDFLRQRGLPLWERNDPRREELIARRPANADAVAVWARDVKNGLSGRSGPSGQSGPRGRSGQSGQKELPGASTKSTESTSSTSSTQSTSSTSSTQSTYPEILANGAIALITVACFLLDRQLSALADAFRKDGGFTERLYQDRLRNRRS
ncbi:MAG: four helix bundle protein [candidate division Zixibacteria bacterium]|nr:four helix bundle protein [candidate division Zixibacteria bacterium]